MERRELYTYYLPTATLCLRLWLLTTYIAFSYPKCECCSVALKFDNNYAHSTLISYVQSSVLLSNKHYKLIWLYNDRQNNAYCRPVAVLYWGLGSLSTLVYYARFIYFSHTRIAKISIIYYTSIVYVLTLNMTKIIIAIGGKGI